MYAHRQTVSTDPDGKTCVEVLFMPGYNKLEVGTFFHHIVQAAAERGESVADTILWVRDLGYAAAELDADDLKGTEYLEKIGMKVSSIYRNYRWQEKIDEEMMLDHVRLARSMGASKIMAIPGFYSDKCKDQKELERMHEGMRILSSIASENGLMLTIEDYDNALSPIATMEGMNSFLEAVPELKVTLDTGNFIFSGEDILAAQDLFIKKITHVHLKDSLWSSSGEGDILESTDGRRMYPCAVLDGDIPIDTVLQKLCENGGHWGEGRVPAEERGTAPGLPANEQILHIYPDS